jgi:hypothetical protein
MFGFLKKNEEKIKRAQEIISTAKSSQNTDEKFREFIKSSTDLSLAVDSLIAEVKDLYMEIEVKDGRIRHLEQMVRDPKNYIDSTRLYNQAYYYDYLKNILTPSSTILTIIIRDPNYIRHVEMIADVVIKSCAALEVPLYWSPGVIKIFFLEPIAVEELQRRINKLKITSGLTFKSNEHRDDFEINSED